jgi:hypothetical protein
VLRLRNTDATSASTFIRKKPMVLNGRSLRCDGSVNGFRNVAVGVRHSQYLKDKVGVSSLDLQIGELVSVYML